jgi:sugar O-acyltransferase (sialic acid O-acetyltransferase NeuD family)
MENLIIIGARGFGREVYHLATQCKGYRSEFEIKGFLDDKANALEGVGGYPPILGPVEAYVIQPDDVFVCALGDTRYKKHYVELVQGKGGVFHTLIHPSSIVSPNASLCQGSIILANVCVSCEVRIGEFVTLQPFCLIGHDAQIGAFAHLNAYAFMGGYAQLEEGVTLHTGAKVLPHKKVSAWATVGAGSVVLRHVKPGATVFGMPAMQISD